MEYLDQDPATSTTSSPEVDFYAPPTLVETVRSDEQIDKARKSYGVSALYRRAKQAAVLAVTGAGAYAVANEFTPHPEVSSAGTDAMIGASEFMQDNGPAALIAVAGFAGITLAARLKSAKVREMLDITKPSGNKGIARKVLPPLIVTAAAAGTGLGAEAGRGANEPVNELMQIMNADIDSTYAIVAHEDVLPFNHSAIGKQEVAKVSDIALGLDADYMPFYMDLGAGSNPDNTANPSSAGIIAVPEDRLPSALFADASTGDQLQVATTSQVAAVGDMITVEGEGALVVNTLDTYPGLDRTAVLTTSEQYQEHVLHNEPPFGIMLSGIESQAQLEDLLRQYDVDVAAIPAHEWQERYSEFWDRSVTPLGMQFLLMISALGGVGAGFIAGNEVMQRRRSAAIQNVMGVDKATLVRANYLRSGVEAAKATALATTSYVGLVAVINSSQYGVALEANAEGLGAGAMLVTASTLASTGVANGILKKMDSANEVR